MSGNLGPILFFCAAVGVGICSIMAYYGFQGRINTIGVDLGTTLSVVGYKSRSKVSNLLSYYIILDTYSLDLGDHCH